jgi:hypothetical protein
MQLQDLPEKTIHRLVKGITWTEVDAALPGYSVLRRRFILRAARLIDPLRNIPSIGAWFRR